MAFTETNDVTKPAGGRARSLGDDDIREGKRLEIERQGVDHDRREDEAGAESSITPDGTIGYHKKTTLIVRAADPAAVANAIILYGKDVDVKVEVHSIDEDGNVIQWSVTGKINPAAFGDLSTVPGAAGALPVANGGTAATTAAAARAALSAALLGANADITSLTGLTTPLSKAQGGTGQTAVTVDRGDPAAVDAAIGDLTTDGTWNDLDLSAVVPAGAVLVFLSVLVTSAVGTDKINFRKNGNANAINIGTVVVHSLGTNTGDIIVACDASRIIEYMGTNSANFTVINITVKGWSF